MTDRCHRCAECCRIGVLISGRKRRLDLYCPALDLDTKRCMMYDWRHTAKGKAMRGGSECAKTWSGVWRGLFPRGCGYVRWYHPAWDTSVTKVGVLPLQIWSDTLASTSRLRAKIKEYNAGIR